MLDSEAAVLKVRSLLIGQKSRKCSRLIRFVSVLVVLAGTVLLPATGLATTREVMKGVMVFIEPGERVEVIAAPDQTFWILAHKFKEDTSRGPASSVPMMPRRARPLHLRHLDKKGRRISEDIVLTDLPGLGEVSWAYLVGFGPKCKLYLRCCAGQYDPVRDWLVLVGAKGVEAVSNEPFYFHSSAFDARNVVADMTNRLRAFLDVAPRFSSYLIEARKGDFVFLDTVQLAKGEVPPYLYWHSGRAYAMAGPDRFVAAVDRLDSLISLYLLDFATLALLDSGNLRVRADVYREFASKGPNGWWSLVPTDDGFWFFAPVWDISDRRNAKQVNLLRVYRFTSDLDAVMPEECVQEKLKSFAVVPKNAAVVVKTSTSFSGSYRGTGTGAYRVQLDFWGFGSDGFLYHTAETDSIPAKPGSKGSRRDKR